MAVASQDKIILPTKAKYCKQGVSTVMSCESVTRWLNEETRNAITKTKARFTFSHVVWQCLSVNKALPQTNPRKQFTHCPTALVTGYVHLGLFSRSFPSYLSIARSLSRYDSV